MTVAGSDGRYGYRAWDRRPGDDVDPSVYLSPEEMIFEVAMQAPPPPPAGYTPRLMGVERTEPGIVDVLAVGPSFLMEDRPTRQDSGMQPSGFNW